MPMQPGPIADTSSPGLPSLRLLKVMNAVLGQSQTVGVAPPSMRKVVPVMKSLSGLATKQTATAMSLGCPMRATVC